MDELSLYSQVIPLLGEMSSLTTKGFPVLEEKVAIRRIDEEFFSAG